jgi:hypothetical protein
MFPNRLKRFFSLSATIPLWILLLITVLGLGVGGSVWWLGPGRRPWLEVTKDKDGAIAGLHVEPKRIPKAVLAELPIPGDNSPLSDPAQIKALAEHYDLYQTRHTNSHICFDDGTIDYWSKQRRPAWELELQLLSRRLVLEVAERAQARIPYPGDLSKWAERVYPILLKKAQEK